MRTRDVLAVAIFSIATVAGCLAAGAALGAFAYDRLTGGKP